MPKLVYDLGAAICRKVEPANATVAEHWDAWRRSYLGCIGRLQIYASEKKNPGALFLYFEGFAVDASGPWHLQTGYGDLTQDGDRVIFVTKNSRYEFERYAQED